MWYQLFCEGFVIEARRLEDGGLKFLCPFCEKPVLLLPSHVWYTEQAVHTRRRVWCPWEECDVPFEIKHSNFVPEDDPSGHPQFRHTASVRFRRLCKVWRSHNER